MQTVPVDIMCCVAGWEGKDMRVCLRQVQFVLQHFNWWHCSVCRG